MAALLPGGRTAPGHGKAVEVALELHGESLSLVLVINDTMLLMLLYQVF
jgi:hypothetical protein